MQNLNKIRQLLALLITLAGISLVVALLMKGHTGTRPIESVPRLPDTVDMSLQKIHFTETRDGVKKWDIVADRADYDKGREIAHLTGIRLTVAGDRTTGDIAVNADRADYSTKTHDVQLFGNVAAQSASGMKFTTDRATFIAEKSIIRSPGLVRFSDSSMEVEGTGMEFSTSTRDIHLSRGVTASIRTEAGRR